MFEKLLLDEVGQWLARKPFQGFSWQQGAKYIQVTPRFSKAPPLWELEDKVLENELSLFGVKPQQLEQQISDYRKKSRVIRWLLRLFTRINSKIAVWSYYQQCLSFRALSQREPLSTPQQSDYPVDFTMIQPLLPYLRQDIKQFEQMIDRHLRSLEVTEDEFLLRYQAYARKQEARFFKLLEKQLKGLSDEQQILLRNTLKKEYRGMRKMMNRFKDSCLKRVKQVKDQLSPFMPNPTQQLVKSEILYAEEARPSSNISPPASSYSAAQMPVNNSLENANDIEVLMKQQRREIKRLLVQEDSLDKETKIELFLEDSFEKIRCIIESRLREHQALVDDLRLKRLNYQQVIPQSEALQSELIFCFKTGLLLFHPDKQQSPNESIKQIQHELCRQFLHLRETSLNKLRRDIEIIRRLIPKESNFEKQQQRQREKSLDEVLQEYRNLYQGFTDDYINFYEKEKERHDEMIARHDEMIARHDERMVEIQELLEAARMGLPQNQAAASDSETAATNYSFFPVRR